MQLTAFEEKNRVKRMQAEDRENKKWN